MTLDADSLAERRRLKRRLSRWRIGAIIGFIILAAAFAMRDDSVMMNLGLTPYVARVNLDGVIVDDKEQRELLAELAKSDHVHGVIIHINSPGGTTVGAEALYQSLRELGEKKPLVAVFGTAATSAAYLAGIATDHIVARGNSITGSVGVIMQWPDVTDLLQNIGVRVEEVRSGPLKAVPSPFTENTDPAARALIENLINESREWFVDLVVERRKVQGPALTEMRTGRIYTGRQALEIGLVDEIGGEEMAIKWLEEKRNVPKGLEVIDRVKEKKEEGYFFNAMAGSLVTLAESLFGKFSEKIMTLYQLNHLDGLISLWHPKNTQ